MAEGALTRPSLDSAFLAFAALIRTIVSIEPWPRERPKYHMHYLVVDYNKYWAMGRGCDGRSGAPEDLAIIHRQQQPSPEAMLDDIDVAIIAGSRP